MKIVCKLAPEEPMLLTLQNSKNLMSATYQDLTCSEPIIQDSAFSC